MNDENMQNTPENSEKAKAARSAKTTRRPQIEEPELPKVIDMKAAHRKVMFVMIAIFVAILLIMVLFQSHLDFASSGGM